MEEYFINSKVIAEKHKNKRRFLFWLTSFTSLIYLGWRIFFTIPFAYGTIALICGILLVVSEAMGIFEALQQFQGMQVNYEPKKPIVKDWDQYPDVDVFIATYNESEELLFKTINGCKHMEYPDKRKVHIYICDDSNRPHIERLASDMKVGYITRAEHIDAKAGNLNNAMKCTKSPLIATFDADMIPLHSFLMETVPYFFLPEYEEDSEGVWHRRENVSGEKIGFIQAPQSFYNADLFQYYLYSESRVPNEQDFFYRDVQLARNDSNSAIYGGSNTVISREALNEIGGFYTGVITEDFATGISIQAKGYRCYAISLILALGLAPTDLKSLIKQRERWARGCIQTLKKVRFLFMEGLHKGQKISYLSSLLYWYTPFRRFMYIISPILFSVFGIMVVDCNIFELLLFWFPYYMTHRIALRAFSNNIRNDRWSNVYDTILFPSLLVPVFLETIGLKQRTFVVTAKERLDNERRYQWMKALPHMLLSLASIYGIYCSIAICLATNSIFYFIIIFWLIVNLYSLIMSTFFMLGRRMYRQSERFYVSINAELSMSGKKLKGITSDVSEGGFSLLFQEPLYVAPNDSYRVQLWNEEYTCYMEAQLTRVARVKDHWIYGFRITQIEGEQKSQYYQLIYDRIHTLPIYLEKHSSFFDDLSRNILFRTRSTKFYHNERLPQIHMHTMLMNTYGKPVVITLFDYETCTILVNQPVQDKMKLICGNDIVMQLHLKAQNEQEAIYHVDNLIELKDNRIFTELLLAWIVGYKRYQKEQQHLEKLERNATPIDEFDEAVLYWEDH